MGGCQNSTALQPIRTSQTIFSGISANQDVTINISAPFQPIRMSQTIFSGISANQNFTINISVPFQPIRCHNQYFCTISANQNVANNIPPRSNSTGAVFKFSKYVSLTWCIRSTETVRVIRDGEKGGSGGGMEVGEGGDYIPIAILSPPE